MKHIRKFNKLNISEDIELGWDRFQDRHKKIAEDKWGVDIEDSIREIFQEFYDLIYERFTEIKFSQNYRGDIGERIIIQFVYNNIFYKIPLDEVSDVMIKVWTELGQSIKKFQSIHHCKLVDIDTMDPSPQDAGGEVALLPVELYSINWKVKLVFEKNI